jgi:ABC-type Co2+ transport system permease subunit
LNFKTVRRVILVFVILLLFCSFTFGHQQSGPVGVEEFAAWFVDTFAGVGAKTIVLSLQQVSWQMFAAEPVESILNNV